ncbi:hypothetical protein PFICI_06770 [Pestalotiopsis fici W106-1]|uniref:Heterokaryon incompatibility domain-containing protein n=1 Tax=Pestalotiopsis fici (strain W106-1 / CGMCC3.15140) TaxID=1229662 RepID=W3X6P1_PESFW|nr:uncharacterized protein PFICI_06770 [Pestalotiopsis fici W106-1]ETS81768.1 hypothetical protein PFICI_06770 [Pestalotiopsis fici W106-1]
MELPQDRSSLETCIRPVYVYQNLPPQSIRLIRLEPGSYEAGIVIRLEPVQFRIGVEDSDVEESDARDPWAELQIESSQARGSPIEYEALSYAWGPKGQPMIISIEGEESCIAHVTQNLYIALKHLRLGDRVRVLWIDALCIDQENNEEKSAQVAIMADIYQCASRVVAWLGPEADGSNLAMLSMYYLGSQIAVNWPGPNGDSSRAQYAISAAQGFDGVDWIHGRVSIPLQAPELNAIYHLLSRPWFGRLWIRQEIFLANSDAEIMCGMHRIRWTHFRHAMMAIQQDDTIHDLDSLLRTNLWSFTYTDVNCGYSGLRLECDAAKCEDPRDRIYATMRLYFNGQNVLKITPDYTKTVGQVYTDAALRYIRRHQDLALLQQCELNLPIPGPSWVPDWSRNPGFCYLDTHSWANSCLSMSFALLDGRVLQTHGKLITVIEHLWKFDDYDESSADTLINTIRTTVQSLLDKLVSGIGEMLERCAKTLLGVYISDIWESPATSDYPSLRDFESLIAQVLAGCSAQEIKERLGREKTSSILWFIVTVMAGRQLFTGTNDLFGRVPIFAQPGDHIYVLIPCEVPLVLRPLGGNQYMVVGACYAEGIMYGEALLGPFPKTIRPVLSYKGWRFQDIDSGKVVQEDPRLVKLGVGLQEFREELEQFQDKRARLMVDVDILRRAGVMDLQKIELV